MVQDRAAATMFVKNLRISIRFSRSPHKSRYIVSRRLHSKDIRRHWFFCRPEESNVFDHVFKIVAWRELYFQLLFKIVFKNATRGAEFSFLVCRVPVLDSGEFSGWSSSTLIYE